MKNNKIAAPSLRPTRVMLCTGLIAMAAALTACGDKAEKKPGQALASVNGEEITVMQLNEELGRVNVPAAQQEAARKQLLESLIDRQLLQGEAAKEKLDRDPKVVQAVERAKSLIIAQAYLQKRIGTPTRPTKEEVAAYYSQNPQFFANRKQFDMRQLVLATRDVSDPLKEVINSAKSIDDVAAWLDGQKVRYARAQLSRSSAEMPQQLSSRLQTMPKGQLFVVREGERSMLISIADMRDAPVTLEQATPQIEQFLTNKKNKEAADAELKRLRTAAKIEYLNKPADQPAAAAAPGTAAPAAAPAAATPAAAPADAAGAPQGLSNESHERGVAGMR
ncbi:EpsD family peptidyl-prolyl cis-trans isomerase [Pseudoduganella albidiflava]|uniref:EpsD family peptidyl-prolyl cis-trans isomerase n=1 Tax=Pseudoduganella albidiflava TaxID=321983 RepID=UPI0027D965DD|nr:EpsD family peptidyl-prolyl cis-trans isomerase [Pseudoduganella albidiflava]